MKLILNLGILSPPMTGVGQYVYRLLMELVKSPDITDMCGFVRFKWLKDKEEVIAYLKTVQNFTPSTQAKQYTALRKFLVNFASVRWLYYHTRDILLHHKLQSDFIYWDGAYTPVAFSGKSIITVHDLSHIRHSAFHPQARVAIMNAYLPQAIQRSTHILTVSEFSKQEIIELFNVPHEKISILPPSISDSFKPLECEQCQEALTRYALPYKKYILSVATLEPRKNLHRLLEAYCKLDEATKQEYPLVFAGSLGWCQHELYHTLHHLQEQGVVKLLGYVPDELLPMIYASAQCFAYVSLYEGYGMPIAEALSCGVPCITSNQGAMKEVGGKEAIYVNPLEIEDIKRGLQEGLSQPLIHSSSPKTFLSPTQAAQEFLQILHKLEST